MRFIGGLACVLLVAGSGLRAGDTAAEEKRFAGYWSGALKGGAVDLPLVLYLKKDKDGSAKWHFDSPFETIKAFKATSSKFTDGEQAGLEIQFGPKISFVGKLNKEGTELKGEWKSPGGTWNLTLKRSDQPPAIGRPQEPKPPFPYRSEDVTYENAAAKVKLAGTLTIPKGEGDGPFPAVVLITGSGPQDRDEEILGHKPFLLIADYLTRRGVAVLRVDDRGVGGSTGDLYQSTSADFAEDVLTGVAYLKGRKEIDGKRIGLIGHSEGGMVAPLAAVQSKDVAFLVLLAGLGYTGEEVMYQQNKLLLEAAGAPKEALAFQLKWLAMFIGHVKQEKDPKVVEKKVLEQLAVWKEKAVGLEKFGIAQLEALADKGGLRDMAAPWWRFFFMHDPVPVLRKVQCPVLALNGELDLQVQYDLHLPAIAKALKEAGNKDVTTKSFPKMNHLFQTCKTGQVSEYGKIEETMAPVVLETMAEWIAARTGLKK